MSLVLVAQGIISDRLLLLNLVRERLFEPIITRYTNDCEIQRV